MTETSSALPFSQEDILLATKFYIPPARPNLVARPRLLERLSQGLDHRLLLVSAPAGFGKTTLISNLKYQISNIKMAWVSLEEGDNDPVRFMMYLVGAFQSVNPAVGQSVQASLQSPQLASAASASPDPSGWIESLIVSLINDLAAAPAACILVLDDYHLIHNRLIHQAIQFFTERQPPHVHLVISSREDPPWPLSRLRARGQMIELRERDLRFTAEEAAAFLNQTMGLRLSSDAVAALQDRTEGWVAGLQLAALSLQDRTDADTFIASFAGTDRHVMDYLLEEVLCHQPEAIQSFLLHTAILDRLCASLCDALLAGTPLAGSSQAMLEQLDAAHLFLIPLDDQREWFRYHHLFADLLRYRLRREQPERVGALHRLAYQWHAQSGNAEETIRHALSIPDVTLAADVVEQHWYYLLGHSRLDTVLAWIRQIPDEAILSRPYLCVGCGWVYVLAQQVERAERYVQASEAALQDFERLYIAPTGRFITQDEVRGSLAAIRAYGANVRGDATDIIEYSRQALAQLPPDASATRAVVALTLGLMRIRHSELDAALPALAEAFEMARQSKENAFVAVSALLAQGVTFAALGKLREAARCYHQAIEFVTQGGGTVSVPAIGGGHLGLTQIHYERYELAEGDLHLERGLALTKQGGLKTVSDLELLQARLALIAGDLPHVESLMAQANPPGREGEGDRPRCTAWAMLRAELALARGDLHAAGDCIAACGLNTTDLTIKSLPFKSLSEPLPAHLTVIRVWLAQGQLDKAIDLLERLAVVAEGGQRGDVLVYTAVFQAAAWHLKRDSARAQERLLRALALAAPEGYVLPFILAGEPIRLLLAECGAQIPGPELRAYADRLLVAFSQSRSISRQQSSVSNPLTEREMQVLRLLAADLDSTQVAEELVLSVSTVRSYIKSIYSKLGVHRRNEALDKAREMGLL